MVVVVVVVMTMMMMAATMLTKMIMVTMTGVTSKLDYLVDLNVGAQPLLQVAHEGLRL